MDPENWQAVLAVHLNGAYNVTRPAFAGDAGEGLRPDRHDHLRRRPLRQLRPDQLQLGQDGPRRLHEHAASSKGPSTTSRSTRSPRWPPRGSPRTSCRPTCSSGLQPDFVAGIVLYLCSENCAETGEIFNAAAGLLQPGGDPDRPGGDPGRRQKIPDAGGDPRPVEADQQPRRGEGARRRQHGDHVLPDAARAQPKPASGGAAEAGRCRSGRRHGRQRRSSPDARGLPAGQGGRGGRRLPVLHLRSRAGATGSSPSRTGPARSRRARRRSPRRRSRWPTGISSQLIAGKLDGMQAYSSGKAEGRRGHHEVPAHREAL